MASGLPSAQQPFASPQPAPVPSSAAAAQTTSPPTKANLKSWWKGFSKAPSKAVEKPAEQPTGIFGVPLRQSITYANVAISLVDAEGKSYIYGYVPIIVAKCGVYLKEKATNVEGIFRLSGSEKRIKELRLIFDSPDRYGKGLDWAGYTVHDAANVLRRYLNMLPEPTIPLELYERFREPLKGHVMNKGGDAEGPHFLENFDVNKAITTYQQLITELPPLNRQLLLYILDLLAVFASKSDENRMDSRNLAAIFQPGMLTHPQHDMIPEEYLLSQDVLVFLIENQDHFLIGMRGTAADEKTVQEVQRGSTPPPGTPTTPGRSKTTMARSASNGSAGAYSVRKDGGLRRNVSVSSRHSRQSNGAPSPASPALTQSTSGGVHRSNTVPSKRSPALRADRLQKNSGSPSSPSPTTAGPPVHGGATRGISPGAPGAPVASGNRSLSSSSPGLTPTASSHAAALTSQERLIPDSSHPEVATPAKERNITAIFNRSPTGETEKKPPNKLRKKRLPGSSNPSAQSSTHSLTAPSPALQPILSQEAVEQQHLENTPSSNPTVSNTTATPPATAETTPRAAEHPLKSRPDEAHNSDKTLKPITSPPSSLHSRSSYNDQSDFDQIDDIAAAAERKEKRSLWRLSRRKDDSQTLGNTLSTKKGSDNGAAQSSSTVGSSSRPRKSFTGDSLPASSDPTLVSAHMQSSNESGPFVDEKKGPIGWLKTKMEKRREEKEAKEERNKSPPAGTDRAPNMSSPALPARAKSMDVKREQPHPDKAAEQPAAQQQPQ